MRPLSPREHRALRRRHQLAVIRLGRRLDAIGVRWGRHCRESAPRPGCVFCRGNSLASAYDQLNETYGAWLGALTAALREADRAAEVPAARVA